MGPSSGVESVPELAFLTQLFVLGSAAGMVAAIVEYRRTGELDRWPLLVGSGALFLLLLGALFLIGEALL